MHNRETFRPHIKLQITCYTCSSVKPLPMLKKSIVFSFSIIMKTCDWFVKLNRIDYRNLLFKNYTT